jgi:hypothetical protein
MLLSRTELHSQDIINKKLQKAKAFSTNLEFIFFFIKYYYDLISESNQNFTVFNSWTILCPIFIIAEFFWVHECFSVLPGLIQWFFIHHKFRTLCYMAIISQYNGPGTFCCNKLSTCSGRFPLKMSSKKVVTMTQFIIKYTLQSLSYLFCYWIEL